MMESLFEPKASNRLLRKYDPLIRFDVDGKPLQERKPRQENHTQPQSKPIEVVGDKSVNIDGRSEEPTKHQQPSKLSHQVKQAPATKNAPSDLKRKNETPANHSEPKKTKQASILSFFNKK